MSSKICFQNSWSFKKKQWFASEDQTGMETSSQSMQTKLLKGHIIVKYTIYLHRSSYIPLNFSFW